MLDHDQVPVAARVPAGEHHLAAARRRDERAVGAGKSRPVWKRLPRGPKRSPMPRATGSFSQIGERGIAPRSSRSVCGPGRAVRADARVCLEPPDRRLAGGCRSRRRCCPRGSRATRAGTAAPPRPSPRARSQRAGSVRRAAAPPSASLVAAPATPSTGRPLRGLEAAHGRPRPGPGRPVDRLLVEADSAQRHLQRRDVRAAGRVRRGRGGDQERNAEHRSCSHVVSPGGASRRSAPSAPVTFAT